MLADHEDAYGHLILDHMRGEDVHEIVERDDGLIDVSGGPDGYFAPVRDWPARQREGIGLVRGRALDIGCGAGRVALHLQGKDHDVVSIDNSPRAVEVCRERGVHDARVLPITRVTSRLGAFDTIVMYGNNFGLTANAKRARWLLRRFGAMTSHGAQILAESRNPYATEDPVHLEYLRRNRRRGRMSGQIRIRVRHRRYATPWFDYLFVSPDEMADLVEGTGWRLGRTIDADENTYISVLEKP